MIKKESLLIFCDGFVLNACVKRAFTLPGGPTYNNEILEMKLRDFMAVFVIFMFNRNEKQI